MSIHACPAVLILQTIARYVLAVGILPYGISKLANLQFQVSAREYSMPLGMASGKILTWAFLGYQPWFQFLLGALETIPALLLFFRRTRRLGALLLFPVLLNVTLMNYAMDLWDATKRISLVLLLLDAFLLTCDFSLYLTFLRALLKGPGLIENRRWRLAAAIVECLIPVAALVYWSHDISTGMARMSASGDFIGERQINSAATWSVRELILSGQDMPTASNRSMYFDFRGLCFYKSGEQMLVGHFKVDRRSYRRAMPGAGVSTFSP